MTAGFLCEFAMNEKKSNSALVAIVAFDDSPPSLALLAAPAPVELEQHVAIQIREDLGEIDVNVSHAPERRFGNVIVRAHVRAHGIVGGRR